MSFHCCYCSPAERAMSWHGVVICCAWLRRWHHKKMTYSKTLTSKRIFTSGIMGYRCVPASWRRVAVALLRLRRSSMSWDRSACDLWLGFLHYGMHALHFWRQHATFCDAAACRLGRRKNPPPLLMTGGADGQRTFAMCHRRSLHSPTGCSLALLDMLRHLALGRCPKPRKGFRP